MNVNVFLQPDILPIIRIRFFCWSSDWWQQVEEGKCQQTLFIWSFVWHFIQSILSFIRGFIENVLVFLILKIFCFCRFCHTSMFEIFHIMLSFTEWKRLSNLTWTGVMFGQWGRDRAILSDRQFLKPQKKKEKEKRMQGPGGTTHRVKWLDPNL